jgi:hypothetical protein
MDRSRSRAPVEEGPDAEIDGAFEDGQAKRLPLIRGQVIEGDTPGYHYYPGRARVASWLSAEGLEIIEEASDWEDG